MVGVFHDLISHRGEDVYEYPTLYATSIDTFKPEEGTRTYDPAGEITWNTWDTLSDTEKWRLSKKGTTVKNEAATSYENQVKAAEWFVEQQFNPEIIEQLLSRIKQQKPEKDDTITIIYPKGAIGAGGSLTSRNMLPEQYAIKIKKELDKALATDSNLSQLNITTQFDDSFVQTTKSNRTDASLAGRLLDTPDFKSDGDAYQLSDPTRIIKKPGMVLAVEDDIESGVAGRVLLSAVAKRYEKPLGIAVVAMTPGAEKLYAPSELKTLLDRIAHEQGGLDKGLDLDLEEITIFNRLGLGSDDEVKKAYAAARLDFGFEETHQVIASMPATAVATLALMMLDKEDHGTIRDEVLAHLKRDDETVEAFKARIERYEEKKGDKHILTKAWEYGPETFEALDAKLKEALVNSERTVNPDARPINFREFIAQQRQANAGGAGLSGP
ncbi:MAG: hypothetical protein KDD76_05930 [Rickettsiales bacterium]|nr:hypothetical protein [Rickettsiales bacterium]